MFINYKNVRRYQDGGALPPGAEEEMPEDEGGEEQPAEGGAPEGGAPKGGGDPQEMLMQIAQVAQQALQSQDCEAAMHVCEMFMQLAGGGGGGAPQDQGEPVYARRGAKLLYHIR